MNRSASSSVLSSSAKESLHPTSFYATRSSSYIWMHCRCSSRWLRSTLYTRAWFSKALRARFHLSSRSGGMVDRSRLRRWSSLQTREVSCRRLFDGCWLDSLAKDKRSVCCRSFLWRKTIVGPQALNCYNCISRDFLGDIQSLVLHVKRQLLPRA